MNSPTNFFTTITILIVAFGWSNSAEAVPDFARKYNMNCSGCHTAYPQLRCGLQRLASGHPNTTQDQNRDF